MTGLLIDYFAGGGGASEALEIAYGRKVDIAINHDPEALAMHAANHPDTLHIEDDVFSVDISAVCAGRPIDVAWFSPDCTHHSRAKGGKPVSNKRRGLAWVVLKVAALPKWQRPRVIHLENVPEFADWGPLLKDGRPDKTKKGQTFAIWKSNLEALGYVVEYRTMKACDYGAPTSRNRLFLTARCDGEPIVWPKPSHFDPRKRPPAVRLKLEPYRTAADCIDFALPCPSIFGRKKPLADATMARIARGVMRYVIQNPKPFIVPLTHHGDRRMHPMDEPFPTVTCAHRGELAIVTPVLAGCGGRAAQSPEYVPDRPMNTLTTKADQILVSPTLIQTSYGERAGQAPRTLDIEAPLGTIVAGGGKHALAAVHLNVNRNSAKPFYGADEPTHVVTAEGAHHNLVAAFLAQHNTMPHGGIHAGHPANRPVSAITATGAQQQLVTAHLLHNYSSNTNGGEGDPERPAKTILTGGHHALVYSFLMTYYGSGENAEAIDSPMRTVTTKDRFGLVIVVIGGVEYVITDIGMRMLAPRELFRAQGFKEQYIINPLYSGKPLTKTAQIRMCGNSVSPPPAIALAVANAPLLSRRAEGQQVRRRRRT